MRLTKDEKEWILGCLPAVSGRFRPELLLERRPELGRLLKEMRRTWSRFCDLYEELDETAREAWENDLTAKERERFLNWRLFRLCGIEEQMREQLRETEVRHA